MYCVEGGEFVWMAVEEEQCFLWFKRNLVQFVLPWWLMTSEACRSFTLNIWDGDCDCFQMLCLWVHHYGADWNISTTVWWIAMIFGMTFKCTTASVVTTLEIFWLFSRATTRSNFDFVRYWKTNGIPIRLSSALCLMLISIPVSKGLWK